MEVERLPPCWDDAYIMSVAEGHSEHRLPIHIMLFTVTHNSKSRMELLYNLLKKKQFFFYTAITSKIFKEGLLLNKFVKM